MRENIVAKILFIIGIAQMAIGIIVGLILGNQDYYISVMNWSIFFTWTIGGFISGMLFIGFAENIRLIHAINEKTPPLNKRRIQTSKVLWDLEDNTKEKIKGVYTDKEIIEIIPAPKEGFCLVKFKNAHGYYVKVLDVSGDSAESAEEVQDAEIKHTIIKWKHTNQILIVLSN